MIGCVLVTYNPNLVFLKKSLLSISKQVSHICIVDNSDSSIEITFDQDAVINISIIKNGGNIGIASAQNIGINYFIERKFEYIFFMDQDSLAPSNLVQKLIDKTLFLTRNKYNVGGIAPTPRDRRSDEKYLGLSLEAVQENLVEVSTIISSGSLIPITNFKKVGLMCDELFIDGVDLEWCWRAKKRHTLSFFRLEDVFLSHTIGDEVKTFLFVKIYTQPPFRFYYRIRNYFVLLGMSHVPLSWKFRTFFSNQVKFMYYMLFGDSRMRYLKSTYLGICSGSKILIRNICNIN